MTYEEIVQEVKKELMKSDVSILKHHLAIQVDITGECEGAFYIELKDGKVYVEPYEYYDRDVKLIVSGKDFLKIVHGSLNPVIAYTVGKLKIEGNLGKALELQQIIDSIKKNEKTAHKTSKKDA